MSGVCNNLIPDFPLFGIMFSFGGINPWLGHCAACAEGCAYDNVGCDAATQYCFPAALIGIGRGCCRDKQREGERCAPKDGGIDCVSGACNNIIPDINLFGITFSFVGINPWFGLCAA